MLAGRVPLAVRRVVGDMLELIVMIAGSAASGSLALAVDGSLGIVGSGVMSGMAMTGATVTGCVVSGTVWARSCVEERAKTATNAVLTERVSGVLWVIVRATKWLTTLGSACDVSGFCEWKRIPVI